MVKVKICGITNHGDAAAAASLGADAVGFILAPSPRRITPERAGEIIRSLPGGVKTVGVFVDESPDAVRRIVSFCGLDLVQFHGHEPPHICEKFMPRVIKAFRVRDAGVVQEIGNYRGKVGAVLLDTYSTESVGGTGRTFDWTAAVAAKSHGLPLILSGGLGPGNIVRALSLVRPFAVDVNSGIEKRPGRKDHLLMEEFMEKIGNRTGRRPTPENGGGAACHP